MNSQLQDESRTSVVHSFLEHPSYDVLFAVRYGHKSVCHPLQQQHLVRRFANNWQNSTTNFKPDNRRNDVEPITIIPGLISAFTAYTISIFKMLDDQQAAIDANTT